MTAAPPPWRWVVVWGARMEREALFADRALANAYAAAHHGVLVPVVALVPVPECRSGA